MAAHVWLVAGVLPLLVRLVPLPRLLRLLTPRADRRPYAGAEVEEIAAAVDRQLADPVHMRRRACLRKGLTLFHFLRLAGHPAVIQFAVYPPGQQDAKMRGHCWVTVGGRDFGDLPDGPSTTVWRHGDEGDGAP